MAGLAAKKAEPDWRPADLPVASLLAATAAGIGAAMVGAVLWAAFVYFTDIKAGLIALAIGVIVGIAIQRVAPGTDRRLGYIGAGCAVFGWAAGTVLCDLAFIAKQAGRPMLDAAASLGAGGMVQLAINAADFMDLLFLAIAVYEGYRFALRPR